MDKPNDNPGQPRKFTERDERSLVRPITTIHNTHGISFTAGKLKNEGDLHHVALILKAPIPQNRQTHCLSVFDHFVKLALEGLRLVRYIKNNYCFRQLRRKGQITAKDRKKGITCDKNLCWLQISGRMFFFPWWCFFYAYVTSNKYLRKQSIRKKRQRTAHECKREERRCERKNCSFVCCYCLRQRCCDAWTVSWEIKYFPATFVKASNSEGNLFLQDRTLYKRTELHKELHKAYNKIGCIIVPISARSPDIHPVENVFDKVRSKLTIDAWEHEIKYELYERVCSALFSYSTEIICWTIESMPNRMNLILGGKGHRLN